ncbi:hypothetical protein GF362_06975 [Candidatus Dojkabacteria bacterium]|nr:hypothetical protein [Candidatus Dojkabacteria bacterium]
MKQIIIKTIIWIIIVNIFALFALNRFNLKSDTAYSWISPEDFHQTQSWDLIDLHSRWDSFWYLDIAKNGYSLEGSHGMANIVFFPIYPGLITISAPLFLNNYMLAGWTISLIFLILAVVYLYKLVDEFHPNIKPEEVICFLIIFPTSFFLNAIYTESLFLFLSILCFYYLLKKNYKIAGITGFFAALTRPTGVFLFAPMLWEFLTSNLDWFNKLNNQIKSLLNSSSKTKKFVKPKINFISIFYVTLPIIGLFSFLFFHYIKFGDLFKYFEIMKAWDRRIFGFHPEHFMVFSPAALTNLSLDLLFVLFGLICIFFIFKKLRTSYGIYSLLALSTPILTGTLMSIGRYELVIFPIFIILASIKSKNIKQIYTFTSILLMAVNIILFVNNYWAG